MLLLANEITGKFRNSTKTITITITNTSSFCGYVRPSRDVIFGHFAGVNEDRLPFSYVPNVHFLRFASYSPRKCNKILIILSMGLCPIDANNLLNRAVIFVLIQLKPGVLYACITKTTDLMTCSLTLSCSYWCETSLPSQCKNAPTSKRDRPQFFIFLT
jgi:hypothetical protein